MELKAIIAIALVVFIIGGLIFLKAIIAIALVVFIIGGLIFLKVRSRKK